MFGNAHKHDELPQLPAWPSKDQNGDYGYTCPAVDPDGTVCGEPMAYARTVREYHAVHHWFRDRIVIGEVNEVDDVEDPDPPHLWCAAGHDWAVPEAVEFE